MRCACAHTLVTCAECGGKITVLRKAPPKPGRTRREDRDERRRKRNDHMAQIRRDVFDRAEGNCEACGAVFDGSWQAHHVVSGSGLRRVYEDTSTVIALCGDCHRAAHRGDVGVLRWIARWAEQRGSTLALAAVERRMVRASRRGADGATR